MNMFYYHLLTKKLIWPVAGQTVARWKIQKKEGRVWEISTVIREVRCEVTKHKPHGKI